MKEEGRGGVSELGSDLDPDPWKILLIWIQQNDADPLDPDPQHCFTYCILIISESCHRTEGVFMCFKKSCIFTCKKIDDLKAHLLTHHNRYSCKLTYRL